MKGLNRRTNLSAEGWGQGNAYSSVSIFERVDDLFCFFVPEFFEYNRRKGLFSFLVFLLVFHKKRNYVFVFLYSCIFVLFVFDFPWVFPCLAHATGFWNFFCQPPVYLHCLFGCAVPPCQNLGRLVTRLNFRPRFGCRRRLAMKIDQH